MVKLHLRWAPNWPKRGQCPLHVHTTQSFESANAFHISVSRVQQMLFILSKNNKINDVELINYTRGKNLVGPLSSANTLLLV